MPHIKLAKVFWFSNQDFSNVSVQKKTVLYFLHSFVSFNDYKRLGIFQ